MSCGQPTSRRAVVNGREIEYDLHRSPRRRKSIALVIEDQRLRVLAPKRTTLKQVDELLRHRADWIHKRLSVPAPAKLRDQLNPGGRLPLLSQHLPVEVGEVGQAPFAFDSHRFLIDPDEPERTTVAERWLREYARTDFTQRVQRWSQRIGAKPARVQIRDQKTRWGSASSSGTLSLNWRLIFAEPEIIDYVVVHELCHLIQPNHSAAYWELVASYLPDYQAQRQALKDIGDNLVW